MTWVAVAVVAVGVGTAAYTGHQQRKANDSALKRTMESEAEDARLTAKAEADSALAAGAQVADKKRRRSASALGSGTIGTPGATTSPGTVTALGGGAGTVGAL